MWKRKKRAVEQPSRYDTMKKYLDSTADEHERLAREVALGKMSPNAARGKQEKRA